MRRPHWISSVCRAATLVIIGFGTESCLFDDGFVDRGDDQDNPPSTVTDLKVMQVDSSGVTLRWTSPHGGSPSMIASGYDLRYSTAPIDQWTWYRAIQVEGEPRPLPQGRVQTMVVTGLPLS